MAGHVQSTLWCAIFLVFLVFSAELAQARVYDKTYLTRALDLPRGTLARASKGATYLDADQACDYVREKWGWRNEHCGDVDKIVFDFLPSVESLLIYRPNSDGYVRFDDWRRDDRDQEIDAIWRDFEQGLRERGNKIGMTIYPERWRVYPTLNEEKAYLYYAVQLSRDDSDLLYVRATQFDRSGYVSFMLVPRRPDVSDKELRHMIEDVLSSYELRSQNRHDDFRKGDAVAVVGTIGVLARLLGVQHVASVMAVAVADALDRAKEFWYLSFLSIALFARRIFRRSAAA